MPQEYRYVLFSSDELCAALVYDLRTCRRSVTPGFVKSLILEEGVTISVTLVYTTDSGSEMPVRFEHHEVLRALVVYCSHRKIPLPAKAHKSLEIRHNRIALLCVILPKESPRPAHERIQTIVCKAASDVTPLTPSQAAPQNEPQRAQTPVR